PGLPAGICQVFQRMPRVPVCLAGILWPNAAKRHIQETSSGFSRSGKFTRTGTASLHFDLAFCAGGVAVLLDQQAISHWQHTTSMAGVTPPLRLQVAVLLGSRRHGRARPTSRWPAGHLDSVDA